MLGGSGSQKVYWKPQPPVDYIDTSLTIDTFEEVVADLSDGKPCRLWYVVVEQTNNGATAETLELEITINGTAYTFTRACDSAAQYFGCMNIDLTASDFAPQLNAAIRTTGCSLSPSGYPLICESVGLVRIRQTTDVDAVSAQIEVNIVWEKLVGV